MNTTLRLDESVYKSVDQIRSIVSEIATVYMLNRPQNYASDRREVERINVTMPVGLVPLDNELQPSDHLHHGISRDISPNGIGLVTTSPIAQGKMLITLEPYHRDAFKIIAEVVYCNDFGYYFQVGCKFVMS